MPVVVFLSRTLLQKILSNYLYCGVYFFNFGVAVMRTIVFWGKFCGKMRVFDMTVYLTFLSYCAVKFLVKMSRTVTVKSISY